MKQSSTTKKLLAILAVAVVLSTLCSVLSLTDTFDPLRALVSTLSYPLTRPFGAAGQAISGVLYDSADTQALREQLEQKERELVALRQQLAALQQLQKENEQLRDYLSLPETGGTQLRYTDAAILYRGPASERTDTVVLNRGSRHGIKIGMPVLSAGGLYGTVSEVGLTTCTVTTLLSFDIRIGATDVRSGIGGTLCGPDEGENLGILRYLDGHLHLEQDLKVGDVIATSGLGEAYPQGLLIGEITRVEMDPYDRTPRAYIKYYADYQRPDTLLIVIGEQEENATGGDAT